MFDCKKYVHNPHQWFIMQQFFSLKNYFAQIKFFMFWNLSLKCALDISRSLMTTFLSFSSFHFYEIYFDNTHARTFLLIFFRFQDVCFRFVFQSIKMMYPLGTTPFPSLWRHQMKCLLISERIFFFKTWLKHTNNQRMLNGQYTPQWTVVCKKYTNYLIVTKIQLQKCISLMFDG